MSNQTRAIFLFITIVAVLFVSAFGTTNVYADDGTLPPPETEETAPPSGEEEVPVTEPVTTEVPATEGAPTEEAPVVEEQAPAEAEAEVIPEEVPAEAEAETLPEEVPAEADAETLLEQVPGNTTVTVLNEEGEAQPLVSEESAEAILVSEPLWCPEGQSPTPGENGCTQSYSSFTELLSFLLANETDPAYQQAGTIYVQKGVYAGGESSIDFNSYNFQSINSYNLTVHGGWQMSDSTPEPTDMSQFNAPIIIGSSTNPWAGSLTFNNISISHVYNQAGLTLFSQGAITLTNVEVTKSQGGAALTAGSDVTIDNSKFNDNKKFGATIKSDGSVSITGSDFSDYEISKDNGYGLQVNSLGTVLLAAVTANNNETFGADVTATGPVFVVSSAFSGNVSYSYSCGGKKTANGGYGLKVVSTEGPIMLDTVTANDNYFFGAHLEGPGIYVYNSSFNSNGSDSISNPKGYGLEALSTGGVNLINVQANDNQLFGANVKATDDVIIQYSLFNGNKSYKCTCNGTNYYGYGLQVVTTGDGDISMLEVKADGNYLFGAHLEAAVVDISSSSFSNNSSGSSSNLTGKGLEINSTSHVNLSSVTASNNQLFGANIQSGGDVLISKSVFSGHKVYTSSCKGKTLAGGGYGLQVIATGEKSEIALSGVQASDNYLYGAHLAAAIVLVSGDAPNSEFARSVFNSNKEGLTIESSGRVALDNVDANDNLRYGATIQAGTGAGINDTVRISNSFFNGNHSYTSSSCQGKTYYGYGLKVITTADYVSLDNVEANNNYLFGAHLEGGDVDVIASFFNNNGTGVITEPFGKGLEIVSTEGDVFLSNVKANNNQLFGANIQANDDVTVMNSVFNGNKSYKCTCNGTTYYGYGLQVVTNSEVFVSEVTAESNYLFGAHLEGSSVIVEGSSFSFNSSPDSKNATGRGLEVKSTGDVLLRHVTANNNQLFGATIEADGAVDILSSVFANNKYYTYSSCKGTKSAGYGLKVVAVSAVLLGSDTDDVNNSGVQAYGNGAEGAILQTPSTATVLGGQFNGNGANGLTITADDTVTLTNVTANGNSAAGASVAGQYKVDVTGGQFNDNGANGLTITAKDTVTLTNVTANGNAQDGVNVTGVCSAVNVYGGTFKDNDRYGIKVIKASYTAGGTQVFANNRSGNVFQDPGTCFSNTNNSSSSNSSNNNSNGSSYSGGHWNWWYWFSHRH